MSRIAKLAPDQRDERLVAAIRPDNLTDLEQGLTRYFAHCPEQAPGLMGFGGALKRNRTLPERLVELVRLRVAFLVGFGRLAATWHMVEELPEAFRAAESIAPWGADKIQVR